MFDVEYKGANAIVLATKNVRLVFDPAVSVAGGKDVNVEGAIEVVTEPRFASKNGHARLYFDGPGEYEVADAGLVGFAAQRHLDADGRQATIYRVLIGDVRIAVLGNIAPKLTEQQLEDIGVVDVVVMPVGGGGYTLDATAAAAMVRQLDPRVVIPVHYADDSLAYEVPQDTLEVFIGELGATVLEAGIKWKLKSASVLPEQLTVVKIEKS